MATQHVLAPLRQFWVPMGIAVLLACQGSAAEQRPESTSAATTAARLVRAALEDEMAGNNQSRDALLRQALDVSPNDASVNWQLGRLRVMGLWQSPVEVERAAQQDPRLTQYCRLRDAAGQTVADQADLRDGAGRIGWRTNSECIG